MNFKQLSLVLTKKCNAECDICAFDCSPRNQERMQLKDALNYIDSAAAIGTFKRVGITGGEPFLYYEDLLTIIKRANSYNMAVYASTNGFWGESEETCKHMLQELAASGLTRLDLSVDQYHAKYINYESINNILRIANNMCFEVFLASVVTKKSDRLSTITSKIGENILGFRIFECPCLPVGRASEKINEKDFITRENIPKGRCLRQDNLLILPDGNAYGCCSPAAINKSLCLGCARDEGIEKIIKNYNSNVYYKILESYGTQWFVDLIKNNNLPIPLNKRHVMNCDLCRDLFKDEEYLKHYRTYINEEKIKLSKKFININQCNT